MVGEEDGWDGGWVGKRVGLVEGGSGRVSIVD